MVDKHTNLEKTIVTAIGGLVVLPMALTLSGVDIEVGFLCSTLLLFFVTLGAYLCNKVKKSRFVVLLVAVSWSCISFLSYVSFTGTLAKSIDQVSQYQVFGGFFLGVVFGSMLILNAVFLLKDAISKLGKIVLCIQCLSGFMVLLISVPSLVFNLI